MLCKGTNVFLWINHGLIKHNYVTKDEAANSIITEFGDNVKDVLNIKLDMIPKLLIENKKITALITVCSTTI